MLDNALYVKVYMQDKSSDELFERTDIRFVVERGLQNVGEAVYQLRRIDSAILARITDSDRVIAMRHVLVHGYDEIRPAVLWNVVDQKLDTLIREVQDLLQNLLEDES